MNIDNIIYPNESFEEYKPKLLEVYKNDYGEECIDIIKKRMENTLYIFDSNPKEKMEFYINNQDKIHDIKYIRELTEEYEDYIYKEKKIDSKINNKLYKIMRNMFKVNKNIDPNELLKLDYDSYSLENRALLKNDKVSDETKEILLNRRENYINKCHELGVEPITDYIKIYILKQEKELNEQKKDIFLLKNTKWGKNLTSTIRKYNHNYRTHYVYRMIKENKAASCNHMINNKGRLESVIVYYPLISNVPRKSLDRFILHENRHVIESASYSGGITLYSPHNKYYLMDEVRTESKTLSDLKNLDDNTLWSREEMDETVISPYEELLKFTDDFFESENEVLNYCGMYGAIFDFERIYNEKDLYNFEKLLEDIKSKIYCKYNTDNMDEEKEEAKKLVKKLKDNASKK